MKALVPGETGAPAGGFGLFEAPLRDLVLIPAEVMAQFMEVGQPDFIAKNRLITFGVIPEVIQEKQDLGRQRRSLGQFTLVLVTDKHPEDVRFPALGEERGVGVGLITDWDTRSRRPDGGRETVAGGGHHLFGNAR